MKYLTYVHNLENINDLMNVDGFIIGNATFSSRLTSSQNVDEINDLIFRLTKENKEIFLTLNKMYLDEEIDELKFFLTNVNTNLLTGILVTDLGVVQILIDLGLEKLIVWQGETLSTNPFDFNVLANFNAYGSFVAKEITLEDIKTISQNKKYNLFIIGHGHLNMFYSRRHLIKNFKEEYNLNIDEHKTTFHLVENKRDNHEFPVLEDNHGTYVFRSSVVNSFKYLDQLKEIVDYFIIDPLFKDDNYTKAILSMYQNGFDDTIAENLKTSYNEVWDDGFFETKTVYIKE